MEPKDKITRALARAYYSKKMASEDARVLLGKLGEKIETPEQLTRVIEKGQPIVQAHGSLMQPKQGHAAFYISGRAYHLRTVGGADCDPSWADVRATAKYDAWTGIAYDDKSNLLDEEKMRHMAEKGHLYALPEGSDEMLKQAIRDEIDFFKEQPFAYGTHYNCNTFVNDVLVRVFNERILERTMTREDDLFEVPAVVEEQFAVDSGLVERVDDIESARARLAAYKGALPHLPSEPEVTELEKDTGEEERPGPTTVG